MGAVLAAAVLIILGVLVALCPSRLLRDQDQSAVLGRRFGMVHVRVGMVVVGALLCVGGLTSAGLG